jgi:cytochrome c-type biogenesis protein
MPIEVSHWGALLAGLISFLSPCVLPLVPPYLCYMAGVTLDQLTGESDETIARRTIMLSSAAFVLGFSTVFVAAGATASVIGRFVASYSDVLAVAGGVIIIVMGLHFLGVFRIALLHRQLRVDIDNRAGPVGSYLLGLAFAVGWTPCIGPVLGTILFVAGAEQTAARGAGLLAVYSLGLGVPFIVAGLFAGPFLHFMRHFRSHYEKVERVMGAALVLTGILIMTGQITAFSFWLLSIFPNLALIG